MINNMEIETFAMYDIRYTVVPSGYRDIKILITEDSVYNLSVSYLSVEDYRALKQAVEDDAAPGMQCLECGWEGPVSVCCPPEEENGDPCCPACGAIVIPIPSPVDAEPIDRGDVLMECPACGWIRKLKECCVIRGDVNCCPRCGTSTYVTTKGE